MPNPSSSEQDVLILTHWTMARLAGDDGIPMDTEETPGYANCLVVILRPGINHVELLIAAHRGDTLCMVEEDHANQGTMLGGREIDRACVDVQIIEQWISTCSR